MSVHLITGLSGSGKSSIVNFLCKNNKSFRGICFSSFAIKYLENKFNKVIQKQDLVGIFSNKIEYEDCTQSFCCMVKNFSEKEHVLIDSGASAVDIVQGLFFPVVYGFSSISFSSLVFIKSKPEDILMRVKTDTQFHRKYNENVDTIATIQHSLEIGMHVRAHSLGLPMSVIVNSEVDIAAKSMLEAIRLVGLHSKICEGK